MNFLRIFVISVIAVGAILCSPASEAQSLNHSIPIAPITRPGPGDANCAKPVYPKSSIRNDEQGRVVVAYLVDAEGAILDSKIVKSSGFRELDKEAFYGIAKCQFKLPPDATEPRWMQLTYVWTLQ
jgi:protein TonB